MSERYTEEEIKLRVERSIIDGKLKEIKKQRDKAERKEAIQFYRDGLTKVGFNVYFWDPAKKIKDLAGRRDPFYRVCFAYRPVESYNGEAWYEAYVSFCHPHDNFDRWLAWEDLYNQVMGNKNKILLNFSVEKPVTKKNLYNALRESIVNKQLYYGRKPTLFKEHCNTILSDV